MLISHDDEERRVRWHVPSNGGTLLAAAKRRERQDRDREPVACETA